MRPPLLHPCKMTRIPFWLAFLMTVFASAKMSSSFVLGSSGVPIGWISTFWVLTRFKNPLWGKPPPHGNPITRKREEEETEGGAGNFSWTVSKCNRPAKKPAAYPCVDRHHDRRDNTEDTSACVNLRCTRPTSYKLYDSYWVIWCVNRFKFKCCFSHSPPNSSSVVTKWWLL